MSSSILPQAVSLSRTRQISVWWVRLTPYVNVGVRLVIGGTLQGLRRDGKMSPQHFAAKPLWKVAIFDHSFGKFRTHVDKPGSQT